MVEADFRAEYDASTYRPSSSTATETMMPVELTGKPSADLMPGSRLPRLSGAPHGLMFTHMDALNADLMAFMRERDTRSVAARAQKTPINASER